MPWCEPRSAGYLGGCGLPYCDALTGKAFREQMAFFPSSVPPEDESDEEEASMWRRTMPMLPQLGRQPQAPRKRKGHLCTSSMAGGHLKNVTGNANLRYMTMLPLEDSIALHLCPFSMPLWKSKPLLPWKPCRIISGESNAAGQAETALNTVAV